MHVINDPPTAAQVSVMIERMNNLADDVREMRKSQDRIEQVVLTMAGLKKDVEHMDQKIQHLFNVSSARTGEVSQLDKRVTSLERWHKIIGTAVLASTGIIGWGVQRIEYLYQLETRVQILEMVANNHPQTERPARPSNLIESK